MDEFGLARIPILEFTDLGFWKSLKTVNHLDFKMKYPVTGPNSKTFESNFELCSMIIKCNDDLYIIARTWMTQKMILQLLTHLCSIMAASDSWNISFYCGRIFVQSLLNCELKRNCVLIEFLLTHEKWHFLEISAIMAQTWYNGIHRHKSFIDQILYHLIVL